MRVLAIAQRLDQFSAEGAIVRGVVVQGVREPVRDRGIVSRGPRIGLRRQFFPQLQGNHAAVARHFAEHFFVVGRIDNHSHVHVVFGGGADHCRAADVDVLDAIVVRSAFGDRRFEWIEVHHQEIDRLDVVLFHRGEVLFVPADREQSAMHLRMQRLDAPVHHFGRAGEFGDIDHRESGFAERLCRAAGRNQLNIEESELPGERDQSGLVGDRQQGSRDTTRMAAHDARASTSGGRKCIRDRDPSSGIHSHRLKWQFRLLRPVGAGPWRGRRRVAEAPAHGRRLAHASVDHDLHGSSRAVVAGQEYAFLKLDCVGQGRESPQVAVVQQKYHASSIGQPACLDRGVQMEADREFVRGIRGKGLAAGPGKSVLAVERAAVGGKPDGARVHDAAIADVSVMRRTQRRCAGFSLDAHVARAGNDGRAPEQLSD